MKYFSQFKGLPKQVYLLGILRLCVGIGSMCWSFASLLMTSILGMSSGQASVVVMLQGFSNALGTMAGGKLADTRGRRKTYLFFAGLSFCFYLGCSLTCRSVWVIPFLIFSAFSSNACGPCISALVADFSDEEHRVECFSFLYLCVNLGFAVGPVIGGILFYSHLPLTYLIQGTVFFVVGLILFFFVREVYDPSLAAGKAVPAAEGKPAGDPVCDVAEDRGSGRSGLSLLLEHRMLLIFILVLGFVTVCYAMVSFMLPLQMNQLFGLERSAAYTGRIWSVNGIVIVLLTAFLVPFVKKNHHFLNSAVAAVLYAIGFGMYAFVKEAWLFFGAAVIWSVGEILISTGSGAFIASQSPPSHLARFQSYYEISRYIGRAASPPLCAWIMNIAGFSSTWKLNSAICLLAAAVLILSYLIYHRRSRSQA